MSRETDKLMLRLPVADVAAWLRQELREISGETHTSQVRRALLQTLIAKLGQDEDTKGDDDAT